MPAIGPSEHDKTLPNELLPLPPAAIAGSVSAAISRISAVRAQGWDAVEQIATISHDYMIEWPHIAKWLQQHRGNDFVQQVVGEISGQKPKATKYPIVLLHGFHAAPGDATSFNHTIPDAMRQDGDAVFEVTSPPFESPQERAKAIEPQLEKIMQKTGATKINLVAHSLGGLDARYLISSMGWADRVASLSTVGTPHHGTPAADRMNKLPHAADKTFNAVGREVGNHMDHNPMYADTNMRATFDGMSEADAAKFNAANPDRKGVYYQSWAGVSTVSGHLTDKEVAEVGHIDHPHGDPHRADFLNPELMTTALLARSSKQGTLNDGAVPLESAKWGNYQGAIMGDHFDEVGQDAEPGKQRTGFDPVEFYRTMASNLAKRGY